MPHLQESTTTLEPWLADDDVHKPAIRLGQFYQGQSAFGEAEEWYVHGRAILTQRLGERHSDVATSLSGLAALYYSQGRYEQAEPLFIQALQISMQTLGEDHPDVAIRLNNLAGLYLSLERYAEAEPRYLQAISVLYQRLGESHHYTQNTLQGLVNCLSQALQHDRTSELSDHPLTQSFLQVLGAKKSRKEAQGFGKQSNKKRNNRRN